MVSPKFNYKSVNVSSRRLIWAREDDEAGTSPDIDDNVWALESFGDYSFTLASDRYEARETDGKAADLRAWIELTHHVEMSWTVPYRDGGLLQYALAALCGTKDDCGTGMTNGGGSAVITPGADGTICPTFSIICDTGARTSNKGDNSLLCPQFTVTSIALSANPGSILMGTITGMAMWPVTKYAVNCNDPTQTRGIVTGGAPSKSAYRRVSTPRTEGWRGSFTLYSGTGGQKLTERVTSADITIARQVAPFFAADMNHQNPITFDVGPISNSGNITWRFRDVDGQSILWARLFDDELGGPAGLEGVGVDVHEFKWTCPGPSPQPSIALQFYPMKVDVQFADGGLARELSGTFQAYDDESNEALTTLQAVKFDNTIAGQVGPPALPALVI
jgi:hypothetical protein